MSQAVPGSSGRLTPRWSAAGQNDGLAASLAGLFAAIAMVLVEPPLLASMPSRGAAVIVPLRAPKPLLVGMRLVVPATEPPFPQSEYQRRIDAVRAKFDSAGIDALVATSLASLQYLTGYSGNGIYFTAPYRSRSLTGIWPIFRWYWQH